MPQMISFDKMVASGNDFVVIDNRRHISRDPARLTRELCAQHVGVGADGVLLIENSRKAALKMRIFNSDGSEADACGNGFRCIAIYAHKKMRMPARFQFESGAGLIQAHVKGGRVCVELVKPSQFQEKAELQVSGNRLHYSFINTGVPHAVIFVEALDKIDVNGLGRAIRNHERFRPKGTNVNFVEVQGMHAIEVRTYERGVEGETLACGTGSTASALISCLLGYARSPVRVKTKGGEILTVDFIKQGPKIEKVTLEGPARFVFEGKMTA